MKKIILITLILFFVVPPCFAESKILINEFLIDPQPQSVELINIGDESMDLSGWIIDDNGGSSGVYTIPSDSIIHPNSCLVFSKDFNLNKSTSDSARLFDSSKILIDSYQYRSSPGHNISYSRIPDKESNWSTASATLGFFNTGGTSCLSSMPTPTSLPTEQPLPSVTDEPIPTEILMSYGNVYISEVMVNPIKGDNEWLEIYNGNDFQINLVDWFLDDEENAGSAVRKFSLQIPPKGYKGLILSNALFNNDNDSVRLLDADKNLIDGFEYGKTVQGQSFGRIDFDSQDFCLQTESFEKINNQCLTEPTLNPTKKPTIAEDKTLTQTTSSKITTPAKKTTRVIKANSDLNSLKPVPRTTTYEEILGASDSRMKDNRLEIKYLTVVSFSYSLLTLVSVLFKMTGIYGKGFKVLSSLIRPPRGQ